MKKIISIILILLFIIPTYASANRFELFKSYRLVYLARNCIAQSDNSEKCQKAVNEYCKGNQFLSQCDPRTTIIKDTDTCGSISRKENEIFSKFMEVYQIEIKQNISREEKSILYNQIRIICREWEQLPEEKKEVPLKEFEDKLVLLLVGFSIPSFGEEVLVTPLINYLCETKDPDSPDYIAIMELIDEDKKKQLIGVLMRTMEFDVSPEIDPYYIKLNLKNFVDRGDNALVIVGNKTLRQITINRGNGDYIHHYIVNYDSPDIMKSVTFSGKCKEVETPTN